MAEKSKSKGELLQEKLTMKRRDIGEELSEKQLKEIDAFCEPYKAFLDASKTEREAVETTVAMLKAKGYKEFVPGKKYKAGDKVYMNNRGKALAFAAIGTKPIEEGVRLNISHIDSPRLDLKPSPLYEEAGLGLFKTHYYGGIKKYQWGTIPLSLHGVIVKQDGSKVTVRLGEDEGDPVFCVNDLLPHLGKEQAKRPLGEGLRGEELNILVGSRPFKDDKVSEKVKLNILALLNKKYGIVEADFLSAELSVVPAFKASDVGFDRSLIGSYGHDDRVCAWTSLQAALDVDKPTTTWVTVFADKEEIGSVGATGLDSDFVRYFVEDLAAPYGVEGRTVLSKSKCLSADVNAGFDPTFADVMEKMNSCFLNKGVVVTKYTGAGGKSGTNDASAEYTAWVERVLSKDGVIWQTGELGKVDAGGGGTVAKFVSYMNVDTIDIGVPVLSMHAPFEIVAKTDVYMTYRAFRAFLLAE